MKLKNVFIPSCQNLLLTIILLILFSVILKDSGMNNYSQSLSQGFSRSCEPIILMGYPYTIFAECIHFQCIGDIYHYFDYTNFVIDLIVWYIISCIVIAIYVNFSKKKK